MTPCSDHFPAVTCEACADDCPVSGHSRTCTGGCTPCTCTPAVDYLACEHFSGCRGGAWCRLLCGHVCPVAWGTGPCVKEATE